MPGEMFDRLQTLLDENDIIETCSAQSAAAGWDDPAMGAYDVYDAHRRKP